MATSTALVKSDLIDEELPVDLSQLRAIPLRKTLLLVNNFVSNTSRYLNHFSAVCEDKLATISHKLTHLEIQLAILETKLNSIPDLDHVAGTEDILVDDLPAPSAPEEPNLPPPPPPEKDTVDGPPPPPSEETDVPIVEANFIKLKDDERYKKYFAMRRMNMPEGAIMQKMQLDGVDPSIISMDPEGPTIGSQETQLVVAEPSSPQGTDGEEDDQPPPPPESIVSETDMPPPPPPESVVSEREMMPPPPESEPPSPPPSKPSFEIPQPPDAQDFDSMPPPPPPGDDDDSSEDDFEHVVASPMPPTPELLQAPDMSEVPPEAPQEVEEEEAEGNSDVVKVKDDPAFAKYFKMRQLGMPDGAILQKIMLDGVRPDLLDLDPESPSPNFNQ